MSDKHIQIFVGTPTKRALIKDPTMDEKLCRSCREPILFRKDVAAHMEAMQRTAVDVYPVCGKCARALYAEAVRKKVPTSSRMV